MRYVCRAEGIGKDYGTFQAVRELSVGLSPGEIFGLLGPNGSGKSTTLHMLTGLLAPSRGLVEINGVDIRNKESRRWIGFAPDDLPLPMSLTGWEYLQFHHRLRRRDDQYTAAELGDVLGLTKALSRSISDYSHGMKRKLQLIVAVMHSPKLLVLDEPFRGLDPEAAAVLRELLTVFAAAGGSVLIATHDMLRAEQDCDRVLILHQGEQAALGSPRSLRESFGDLATLEDVFLHATHLDQLQAQRRKQLHAALGATNH